MNSTSVKTDFTFDAAHFLAGHAGKCRRIHGHQWRVEVEVTGPLQTTGSSKGMVVDFKDLKTACNQLAEEFDHSLIIEVGSLPDTLVQDLTTQGSLVLEVPFRPTAENFAADIFHSLQKLQLNPVCVSVAETPQNIAIYKEELTNDK